MQENLKERVINQAMVLRDLHSVWTPHAGQIEPGRKLFLEGKQFIFLECGRKYGKSEMVIYSLYRAAMTTPNAACYFIAPFQKQAKELIWANNRLQNFLSIALRKKYIKSINNSEMRVVFKNGSFIKLDGSDNYESYRGINPHFIAYDEFKDHHPKFHEGMEPNLATYTAPCLIIGTPPESDDNHFVKMADSVKTDPDGAYFNMPTKTNPHIDRKWLKRMKERLIARGDWDVWMREYMAKRVKGGKNAIFPMFNKQKHVLKYQEELQKIKRNYKQYDFYCTCDPGTASVFAVLFTAVHRFTRIVTHLDELYIEDTRETSSRKVWDRIEAKVAEIHPMKSDWTFTYDEAATWFQNEIMDVTGGDIAMMPTQKRHNKKEDGISLIKDQMLYGFWYCTDRCTKLQFEIENYMKDDKGKIPKENDHLIDCDRYSNAAAYYTMVPTEKPKKPDPVDMPRGYTMEQDMRTEREHSDWTIKVTGDEWWD